MLAACILVAAAAVAAGCGGSGSDEKADADTAGALRWLPEQTWLVSTADLSSERLDRAVDTLGRLAAWGLVEPMLPASDGKGLRKAGLEQLAKEMSHDDVEVTAAQIEEAFGNRVGLAITSTKELAKGLDADELPVAMWVELDDEGKARDLLGRAIPGTESEHEHEGVTYYESKDHEVAYALRDDLLVATTSTKNMERLIDVHEGDEDATLATSEDGGAVLGAGVDGALGGVAVQTDPLLDLAASALREQSDPVAGRVADAVQTDAVDDVVADWIGGSAAIDASGLRLRGTWSNPRDLAEPKTPARELVERLPADTVVAAATTMSGSELERVQDLWAQVRDAADLDLQQLVADECPRAQSALCDLGVQLALTVLEDESLATAVADAGPRATATASYPQAKGAKGASNEIVSTHASIDWQRPPALTDAMEKAGLDVQVGGASATVRVLPASPLGAMLRQALADPAATTVVRATYGIDLAQLLTPKGLRLTAEQVDDLDVLTLPVGATSRATGSLEGDADQLGADPDFRDAVEAAAPPKQTGSFGYVDVRSWAGSLIDLVAGTSPDAARAKPLVDNNLADLPGIVWWTAREGSGDDEVGVAELAIPIRE
jgi:hypothetical protein